MTFRCRSKDSCAWIPRRPEKNRPAKGASEMSGNDSNDLNIAVQRVYEEWDKALAQKSVSAALALYTADATIESPLIPYLMGTEKSICRGHEELRRFIELVFQNTPPARRRFRTGYYTDGKTLMWEYPRHTPDDEQ